MLFNSLEFLIFFPVVTLLYFLLPHAYRWSLLLIASCFFYMFFKPVYILILAFTIVIDYFAGIYLEKIQIQKYRRYFLILSIIANIGVLAVFKYYNFLNVNLSEFLNLFNQPNPVPFLEILLPIGLSFHTFQAMSYTIEVYRGHQKAERHFGIYALYVMFYPQLVAGPIERPQNLIPQFYEKHFFDYARVTEGMRLMLWGFFKKIVIADRLAVVSDQVFNQPDHYQGLPLVIGILSFSIQIYCDFSAYSDIAIGSAGVMGFKLMNNFDRPYASESIAEFWKRWHMSLSTWFRDYLFLPLSYKISRKLPFNSYLKIKTEMIIYFYAILITFTLCGLWHGASWTFVIWGGLHGFYLVFGKFSSKWRKKTGAIIGLNKNSFFSSGLNIFITFILICFAWIFFRASSLDNAWYIVLHLGNDWDNSLQYAANSFKAAGFTAYDLTIVLFAVLFLEGVQWIQARRNIFVEIAQKPVYVRWGIYYFLVLAILVFGVFEHRQFIYFQF